MSRVFEPPPIPTQHMLAIYNRRWFAVGNVHNCFYNDPKALKINTRRTLSICCILNFINEVNQIILDWYKTSTLK